MKKTGRNDSCPCGSGRKYKKCCLTKVEEVKNDELKIESKLLSAGDFRYLKNKIDLLEDIFSKYNFEDLVKAIYCINLSLDNRSALENLLALNTKLVLNNEYGSKRINNYDDFLDFFEKVASVLPISSFDDYTTEDFGEVKLYWKYTTYNVLIGTGHNLVYGVLQFLPQVVKTLKEEELFLNVLEYSSGIIEFFKHDNKSNGEEQARFLVPSKILYLKTCEFFESELEKYKLSDISKIFSNDSLPVEKRHFVIKNEKVYPLFNTSILVDFYSLLLKKLNPKQVYDTVNITIYKLLTDLCNKIGREGPMVLFPISVIDNNNFITKNPYIFCAKTKEGVLVAINEEMYLSNELETELEKIKEYHRNNKLILSEIIKDKKNNGYAAIKIPKEQKVTFIIFNQFTDVTEHYFKLGSRDEKYFKCTALDLVFLLLFMDDFNEVELYLNQDRDNEYEQVFGFGGEATHFLTWKQQNHSFAKGAIKYSMLSLYYETENEFVLSYYKNKLSEFPWGIDDFMFRNPHTWLIKDKGRGYYEYVDKLSKSFGGIVKRFSNNCVIFFAHNVDFHIGEDSFQRQLQIIHLVDDLNDRKISRCEEVFELSEMFAGKCFQLLFMPINYAKTVNDTGFIDDDTRKYVYSDLHIEKNNICIRYAINESNLYNDIEKAKDRNVETQYFLELFKPIEPYFSDEYHLLKKILYDEVKSKKEVDVFQISIDYYWSDSNKFYKVNNKAYIDVRKEIAKKCMEKGIEQGVYNGKEATKIIRTMQGELIKLFEDKVSSINRENLHYQTLSIYATSIHNVSIHKKRYSVFNDIDDKVKEEVQEKIVDMREEDKHHLRTLQYLLETNLNKFRDTSNLCTKEDLEFLLAFANWLVVLQDNADLCYNSELEAHINIDFEFIVDVIIKDEIKLKMEQIAKRVYDNQDYTIKGDDEDKKYLEDAIQAFKSDTGIDFKNMLSFIEYLQSAFVDTVYDEISPNVISMTEGNLISGFKDCLIEHITADEIKEIIEYLIIDEVKLKLWKGKIQTFLPINEREDRDYRYDVKPLTKINDHIVFSPVVLKELHNKWKFGLTDFCLPFETGLSNVKVVLDKWKGKYENLMVDDISKIFSNHGYKKVWTNAKLHSLDKKNNHPEKLGDYDLIAIDEYKKEMWLIESKVLSKVGSIHEMYMQQSNFFLNHKYDEKFQRRIDYMSKHYKKFLESQGIDFTTDYSIKPYMVTNKIFFSRYKKIEYPIVSIFELGRLLDNLYDN